MGKKTRKARAEKRDTFAAQQSKSRQKNMLIAIGVLAGVAALIGISVYNFMHLEDPMKPPGAGVFGDEHEHASVMVRILGYKTDFSGPNYQLAHGWVHFEELDGATIHRHSSNITLGFFFETLGITIDEDCYILPDEREFCTNDEFSLKYYINREQVPSINDYVFDDQDRILITYGDESPEKIAEYLTELEAQTILG